MPSLSVTSQIILDRFAERGATPEQYERLRMILADGEQEEQLHQELDNNTDVFSPADRVRVVKAVEDSQEKP